MSPGMRSGLMGGGGGGLLAIVIKSFHAKSGVMQSRHS